MYGEWLVLHQVLAFIYMLGTTITLLMLFSSGVTAAYTRILFLELGVTEINTKKSLETRKM